MKTCLCSIFKNSLFWIVITSLICLGFNVIINLIISYTYLFLINEFVPSSYLFVKYFLILILFIYNWLIIRKIVISWLFEWQFPIQRFSIYKERQNYITYFKARLNNFIKAIEVITNVKYKLAQKEIEAIEYFLFLFNDELNIYESLYNWINDDNNRNNLIKYKMSKRQINYYNLLKSINRVLNENDLKNNLLNLKDKQNAIKMNNFTVNQNFENQKVFAQLNMLLNEIKKTIAKYDWENYTYMSPYYLYNVFFNDTFGSLSLYSFQFKRKFENYQIEQNFTPKGKIHYCLLRNNNYKRKNDENDLNSENNKNNDGALMIFCLPNGGCYELIPKLKIDFYLNNGFSFLCWNYNGYGYSKGRANFSNCKSDILELYDIIVKNPKYSFTKICVMGHSIGGVAACYLAKKRHVDLLISDRNFCDMKRLVNNFYCGQLLSFLIKYLFIGKTDNISNFINYGSIGNKNNGIMNINSFNDDRQKVNRIILYSPIDMLILNDATVKSGVARYFIKTYVFYKDSTNHIVKHKENLLDIIFNKNDKTRFVNNFLGLLHFYYDKDKGNKAYGNTNYIALNVKDENGKINRDINFAKEKQEIDETLFLFFDKFFGICCDNLNFLSAHKVSLRRETIFLDNFFNNLLIWGVQGADRENEDNCEFYSYRGKKILKEAYDILNNFSSNNNHINLSPISIIIKNVSEDLKKILDVMNNLDIIQNENNKNEINNDISLNINIENSLKEKLIDGDEQENEINTNSGKNNSKETILIEDNNSFYSKLSCIKGSIKIFKSFAGHNGLIRPDEREHFYTFLLYTGIIN